MSHTSHLIPLRPPTLLPLTLADSILLSPTSGTRILTDNCHKWPRLSPLHINGELHYHWGGRGHFSLLLLLLLKRRAAGREGAALLRCLLQLSHNRLLINKKMMMKCLLKVIGFKSVRTLRHSRFKSAQQIGRSTSACKAIKQKKREEKN